MLEPRDRRTLGRWSRPLIVALGALAFSIASTWFFRPLDEAAPEQERAATPPDVESIAPSPSPPAPTVDAGSLPPRAPRPVARVASVRSGPDDQRPAPPPSRAARSAEAAAAGAPPDAEEPDVDAGEGPESHDVVAIRGIWPTDADGIRSAVREALPDLRQCYQGWVQANPDLEGTVKASFTITADEGGAEGRVTEVHLQESTVNQPFLEGCVLNVLSALRFEAPTDGPITVTYPFLLHADR